MTATKEDAKCIHSDAHLNVPTTAVFRPPAASALSVPVSPVPSTSSSCATDTASESGSAFNSPVSVSHHSAADLSNSTYVKDFSRLVVQCSSEDGLLSAGSIESQSQSAGPVPCIPMAEADNLLPLTQQQQQQQQRQRPGTRACCRREDGFIARAPSAATEI